MTNEIPVIYEVDETGEAQGGVHFFCDVDCREAAIDSGMADDYKPFAVGISTDAIEGTRCETCDAVLVEEIELTPAQQADLRERFAEFKARRSTT